jgi:lipoprotein-anchoring transpeptidase ErfK/SrfK
VALTVSAVLAIGLSMAGVAYAEDYRDHDGGQGFGGSEPGRSGALARDSEDRYGADRDRTDRDSRNTADRDIRDRADREPADQDQDQDGDRPGGGSGPAATTPAATAAGRPGPSVTDTGDQIDPLDPNIKLAPPDPPGSLVKGTPCTKAAVACVSLGQNKSWLFRKDLTTGETVIDHGPVPIRSGGPGKETPLGDFHVQWKNKNHKSGEFFVPHGCLKGTVGCEGAPMSWAVFFAEGGIAFHEGTLAIRSSGCVRLSAKDAEFYYTALQLGDKVEIRN